MSAAWLRRVDVEALPALEAQLSSAARTGMLWVGGLTPVVLALHHVQVSEEAWRVWPWGAALSLWNLLLAGWAWRGGGALLWRELALVCQASALQGWVCMMFPWLGVEPPPELLAGILTPFVVCSIAPLRPWVAVLATVMLTAPLMVLGLWSSRLLGPGDLWASMLALAGMAALASQLIRVTWASVHQQQERLRASERLAELGRRTAGLAHELKSPMASALNGIYEAQGLHEEFVLSLDHAGVERADLIEICQEWSRHLEASWHSLVKMESFLQGLQRQASLRGVEGRKGVEIGQRLEELRQVFSMLDVLEQVELRVSAPAGGQRVRLDVDVFNSIMLNLLGNSLEAVQSSGEGSRIEVWCERRGERLRVVVDDDGPGVPEGLEEVIFDAMFTTRASQGGTGFGLSTCRDLARGVLGGDLRWEPSAVGARFVLELPLSVEGRWGVEGASQ